MANCFDDSSDSLFGEPEDDYDGDDSDIDVELMETDISITTARKIEKQLKQRRQIVPLMDHLSRCRIAKEVADNSDLEGACAIYARTKIYYNIAAPLCTRLFRISEGRPDSVNESFGSKKLHESSEERRGRFRRHSTSSGYSSDSTNKSEERETVEALPTIEEKNEVIKIQKSEPITERRLSMSSKRNQLQTSENEHLKRSNKKTGKKTEVEKPKNRKSEKRKTGENYKEPVAKKEKTTENNKKDKVNRKDNVVEKKEKKVYNRKSLNEVKTPIVLNENKKDAQKCEQIKVSAKVVHEKPAIYRSEYKIPKKVRKVETELKPSNEDMSIASTSKTLQMIPSISAQQSFTSKRANPAEILADKLKALPQIPQASDVLPILRDLNHTILTEAERIIGREMGRVDRVWWEMMFRDFGRQNNKVSCGIRELYRAKVRETENKKKAESETKTTQAYLLPPPPPPPF